MRSRAYRAQKLYVTYPTLSRAWSQWETFHGFHQELDPSDSELKPEPHGSQAFALQTEIAALAGPEVTSAPAVFHDGLSTGAAGYSSSFNPVSLVWSKTTSFEASSASVPRSRAAAWTCLLCWRSRVGETDALQAKCNPVQQSKGPVWKGLGNIILLLSSSNENKWGLQFKVVTKNLFFPLP